MQTTLLFTAFLMVTLTTTHAQTVLKQEKNTFINPAGLFNAARNGFSHIGVVPASTEVVFISGQWASDATGKLVADDFETQVRQTLKNLKTALSAAGVSTRHVVKQTIYIADYTPDKKRILMKVAATEWGAEVFPTSVIVPLPVLATAPGSLIEIESLATR
ncbi:RidA family protein [Fibrella aquatilis]|uniref:RidA family protein n=1 Tax=Fibrella aquatilis TaxID=2817059 RepID=A0A939G4V9_9BACT|nr:RidA family protein [Fibrella aquatilis]MBO0931936.1 RidA family protein [Fibrella aquatilis]